MTALAPAETVEDVLRGLDDPIRRWARRHVPVQWEDAAQEGRIAAVAAYQRWDGRSPVEAWCWMRAKWAMLDYLRKSMRRELGVPLPEDDARGGLVHDEIGYRRVEADHDLDLVAANCTPGQREILDLLRAGWTKTEIAHERGVSQSAISQMLLLVRQRQRIHSPEPA